MRRKQWPACARDRTVQHMITPKPTKERNESREQRERESCFVFFIILYLVWRIRGTGLFGLKTKQTPRQSVDETCRRQRTQKNCPGIFVVSAFQVIDF
jgi:hypothetical protein